MMFWTCFLTVSSLIESRAPISLLVSPPRPGAARRARAGSRERLGSLARDVPPAAARRGGVSASRSRSGSIASWPSATVASVDDDLRRGRVLQEVAGGAAADRLQHVAAVVVQRDHHDGDRMVRCLSSLEAGQPVMPGIRMSSRTMSGRSAVDRREPDAQSSGLAHDLDPVGRREHRLSPRRAISWSSISSTRLCPVTAADAPRSRSSSPSSPVQPMARGGPADNESAARVVGPVRG